MEGVDNEEEDHEHQFNVTYTHDDNLQEHLSGLEGESHDLIVLNSHQKLSEGWIDGAPTPGVNTEVKSNRY
jgi:hypothetical protein